MNYNLRAFTGGNCEFETVEATLDVIKTAMNEILIDAINDIDTSNNSLDTATHMGVFTAVIGTTGTTISTIAARVYDSYGENPTSEQIRSIVDEVYNDQESTAYAARLAAAKQYIIDTGQYNRGQLESDSDVLEMFSTQVRTVMAVEADNDDYKDELVTNYITNMNAGHSDEQYVNGYLNLYENLGIVTNLTFTCELNNASRGSTTNVVVTSD